MTDTLGPVGQRFDHDGAKVLRDRAALEQHFRDTLGDADSQLMAMIAYLLRR